MAELHCELHLRQSQILKLHLASSKLLTIKKAFNCAQLKIKALIQLVAAATGVYHKHGHEKQGQGTQLSQ